MGADSTHPGSGRATLINCTLTANTAQGGNGGGVANSVGSGDGGAVFNLDGAVVLTNDTLAANTVAGGSGAGGGSGVGNGGAVYNLVAGKDIDSGGTVAASLLLNNSILAASSGGHDLVSAGNTATVSGSHNLVMSSDGTIDAGVIALTANPMLGPLQNNGGPTPTMLPLAGSPILGAGDPSLAPSTDQRGDPRPPDGPTDLGAVQVSHASTGGGGGGTTASPPSLFQALLSLFIDGAALETTNLFYEFIHGDDFNIDNFIGTPSQLAVVDANAAAAGINYNTVMALERFLETLRNPLTIQADIGANVPYAGPFAEFAVIDGAQAVFQAVQL